MIDLRFSLIVLLLSAAVMSDLYTFKIRNSITYGFMLAGVIANYSMEGFKGLTFSIFGILLPVVGFLILYILRIIGAGDVKLFSAVGAIMGPDFIIYASAYSFICGGVIATVLILTRQNGVERLRYLLTYVKSCLLSMELLCYTDFSDRNNGGRFHFSLAIASGTAAAMLWLM